MEHDLSAEAIKSLSEILYQDSDKYSTYATANLAKTISECIVEKGV